jgi:hypothetical protein
MPTIPGLRSPYERVGRLVYFGRLLDKIRLHAAEPAVAGCPISTMFDYIDFDEGRDPVASQAWQP